MTLRGWLGVTLLGVIVIGSTPAHAFNGGIHLEGVEVQGELFINDLTTNFFDPANLRVPPGFGNSSIDGGGTGEASAFIADPLVEFGYAGAASLITTNFTTTGMVIVQASSIPFESVSLNFFSPGFTPTLIMIPVGPDSACSYASAITCTFGPSTGPVVRTYQLTAVPEPASLVLLGLGVTAIAAAARRRGSA